jgi:hypothetical protein
MLSPVTVAACGTALANAMAEATAAVPIVLRTIDMSARWSFSPYISSILFIDSLMEVNRPAHHAGNHCDFG